MKFLASILAVMVATQVAVAVDTATRSSKPKLRRTKEQAKKHYDTQEHYMDSQSDVVDSPAESRIVGGSTASSGSYSSYVLGDGGCGGTLIAPDIVLTAAHCRGAFGSVTVSPNGNSQRINVEREVPHPDYNSGTEAFDFMVLKLAEKATNGASIMSLGSSPGDGAALTIIGYGATSEGGSGSSRLKQATVNKIPFSTCNSQYGGDVIDSIMICAGVNGGGVDSCQGDSGGPIINSSTGQQVGVTSWGEGCARPDAPGVYSRVSGALGWINARVSELSDTGGGGGGGGGFGIDSSGEDNSGGSSNFEIPTGDSKGGGGAGTGGNSLFANFGSANAGTAGNSLFTGFADFGGSSAAGTFADFGSSSAPPQATSMFEYGSSSGGGGGGLGSNLFDYGSSMFGYAGSSGTGNGGFFEYGRSNSESTGVPTIPTEARTCSDSDEDEFHVTGKVGSRGCEWLSINTDRFAYLCEFLDVASTCPQTCEACSVFA